MARWIEKKKIYMEVRKCKVHYVSPESSAWWVHRQGEKLKKCQENISLCLEKLL